MPAATWGERRARENGVYRKSITVGHADLTAAALTQQVSLYDLPAGAEIMAATMRDITGFTGGGAAVATASIGTAAAPTLITAATSVFTTATHKGFTAGTASQAHLATATSLIVQFTGDVNVVGFTAGSVTIDLVFCVPIDIA